MSEQYDGPRSGTPQKIRAPREPPKIKRGTWVEICPGDPFWQGWACVEMCLPGAKVEVRFNNGATMIVARSLIRVP